MFWQSTGSVLVQVKSHMMKHNILEFCVLDFLSKYLQFAYDDEDIYDQLRLYSVWERLLTHNYINRNFRRYLELIELHTTDLSEA